MSDLLRFQGGLKKGWKEIYWKVQVYFAGDGASDDIPRVVRFLLSSEWWPVVRWAIFQGQCSKNFFAGMIELPESITNTWPVMFLALSLTK
jgi:hypothetical protein